MSFLAWTFLLGAAAIIGPIAAHLLSKPRFRRVPFTMLRFLRSGQRESHSRRRLRDLLVLLLRCAAIVLIAFLFAQPVRHVTPEPPEHRSATYLALDDSMSMAYRDDGQTLFERMQTSAIDHVRQASDDTTFSLCALASGRAVYDLNKGQAIAEINRLRPVPRSASLEDFFSAVRQASQNASQDDTLAAAMFSDFSPGVLAEFEQIGRPPVVDSIHYEPISPAEPIDNAAIVGVQIAETTSTLLTLAVTVANYGDAQQRELTTSIAESEPAVLPLDLAAHQRRAVRVPVTLGLHRPGRDGKGYLPIEMTLSPKDGLNEDDSYRVALYVPPAKDTKLLLVGQAQETFLFETAIKTLSQQDLLNGLELKQVTPDRMRSSDLAWANVAVFASLPQGPACTVGNVERYLRTGGRLICFAEQKHVQDATARQLWQAELLPVWPDVWVSETSYPEPQPAASASFDLDQKTAQALTSYRLDKIAVKGLWQCRTDPDAQCIWRFGGGEGFIYGKSLNQGTSLFINTSIDNSLGLLAQSRAWVAFCRYLLGAGSEVKQFAFSTEERPVLYLPETGLLTQLSVENCDGRRTTGRVDGLTLRLSEPAGLGWMKTLNGPELYAPINLPTGETDLSLPSEKTLAAAMERTFVTGPEERLAVAQVGGDIERKPIWQWFAWGVIVLLLAEAGIANRLKR